MAEPITAAQVVPQNVEKIPLWHWRPGARALVVGDRDGASFRPEDDHLAGGRDFDRELTPDLLQAAHARAGTDALAAAWRCSLEHPGGLALLADQRAATLVVSTAGFGDRELLAAMLERVAAWSLLIAGSGGPLDEAILAGGRHVEVLLGLDREEPPPRRDWERAAAIHLVPTRPAAMVGPELIAREGAVREYLPRSVACYGSADRQTRCPGCGTTLVWRSGGRSRLEPEAGRDGSCRACGAGHGLVL